MPDFLRKLAISGERKLPAPQRQQLRRVMPTMEDRDPMVDLDRDEGSSRAETVPDNANEGLERPSRWEEPARPALPPLPTRFQTETARAAPASKMTPVDEFGKAGRDHGHVPVREKQENSALAQSPGIISTVGADRSTGAGQTEAAGSNRPSPATLPRVPVFTVERAVGALGHTIAADRTLSSTVRQPHPLKKDADPVPLQLGDGPRVRPIGMDGVVLSPNAAPNTSRAVNPTHRPADGDASKGKQAVEPVAPTTAVAGITSSPRPGSAKLPAGSAPDAARKQQPLPVAAAPATAAAFRPTPSAQRPGLTIGKLELQVVERPRMPDLPAGPAPATSHNWGWPDRHHHGQLW